MTKRATLLPVPTENPVPIGIIDFARPEADEADRGERRCSHHHPPCDRGAAARTVRRPWQARQDEPINSPVANTNAPPSPTWTAAVSGGVSI
jgi:hypothetical protein